MGRRTRMRLATDAEIQQMFGSSKLQIGFPVRPKNFSPPEADTTQPAEREHEDG